MKEKTRTPHPGALPNYQDAVIPKNKLAGYLLNPYHLEGKHKARVFKSALGFDESMCDELEQAIIAELPYQPATPTEQVQWGQKYEVILPITGKTNRIVDVLTVWMAKPDFSSPSLVTAYVVGRYR